MTGRYLQFAPVVLLVHALLLSMTLSPSEPVLPQLEAMQRITVRVTARPAAPTMAAQSEPIVPAVVPSQVETVTPPISEEIEPILEKIESVQQQIEPLPRPVAEPVSPTTPKAESIPLEEVRVEPVAAEILPDETAYEQVAEASAAPVIQKAVPLFAVNTPPAYPRLARRRGLQGGVLLDVLVDGQGRVAQVKLGRSSGHGILDRAAIKAVQAWSFRPGSEAGVSAEMWVSVPVRFQLK